MTLYIMHDILIFETSVYF